MSWWKPAISIVLLIIGIILSHLEISWFQNNWVRMAWFALAWLPTGLGVLREAIEGVHEGDAFNEFLLMSVASIGAFAIGEYPEAVAVMTLYCIGEALQDLQALKLLESLTSREHVIALIQEDVVEPITFHVYPTGESYLLNLRDKVNKEIKQLI